MVIWLVVWTILKNMKVNGKDYPIYYGKNMFETTNQLTSYIPMKSSLMNNISVLDYEMNPHYL